MRVVIQRVSEARVKIAGAIVGETGPGLLVLLGVAAGDTPEDGEWLAQKIAKLRIFPDPAGNMNLSVQETGGGILAISQFTLIASTRKGNRPSFNDAAKPDLARPLYETFLSQLEAALGRPVARGEFGADMKVSLVNDGPVTIIIDSRTRE
ncbi:MAG: D-aminoacyl-tRNA deacylase [Verrucomicrobia bacterium]|nr:D-aminoacyl-tRNA deacylase [Verrucomicrobiota bacterium]